jgi:hypothetical protein
MLGMQIIEITRGSIRERGGRRAPQGPRACALHLATDGGRLAGRDMTFCFCAGPRPCPLAVRAQQWLARPFLGTTEWMGREA